MATSRRKRVRRPSRVEVEVYDPFGDTWLLRWSFPYDRKLAAQGAHSHAIRTLPDDLRPLGRPDGVPIGVRRLRTETRLIFAEEG